MPNLYFLINDFTRPVVDKTSKDPYIPIQMDFNIQNRSSYHYLHVVLAAENQYIDLLIGLELGELCDITVVTIKKINFFAEIFTTDFFITLKMAPALGFSEKVVFDEYSILYYAHPQTYRLEIFKNAFVFWLGDVKDAKILFNNNDTFGVITNENLTIVGLVLWNITSADLSEIHDYALRNGLNIEFNQEQNDHSPNQGSLMENKEQILEKMLGLKNVDIWELLYYGLKRKLIDTQFIEDYVFAYLNHKEQPQDPLFLEIAGLLNNEKEQILPIVENAIKNPHDILTSNGELYNKVWFYLSIAADMSKANII